MRTTKPPRPAARLTGFALLLGGAGLVVLSLLADRLEIGGGEGFGYQQLIVLIVGIVLILGGLRIVLHPMVNRVTGAPDLGDRRRA